jgi:homocysteine S-methyltransferase
MTREEFKKRLSQKPLLFDGAMGTLLAARGLPKGHSRNAQNVADPAMVLAVHRDYVKAGAQVLETNTWGANRLKLRAHDWDDSLRDINLRGAELARQAAGKDILVAGSVGPLGALMEPYGQLKPGDVRELFHEQISALVEGGVDMLCVETFSSSLEAVQAVEAARAVRKDLPVAALMTFTFEGITKFGETPEHAFRALAGAGVDALGFNCTVGPSETHEILRNSLAKMPKGLPFFVMPNAGYPQAMPDGRIVYLASPEYFREYAQLFLEAGASAIGGCCGTAPEHVEAIAGVLAKFRPGGAAAAKPEEREAPSLVYTLKPETAAEAPAPSRFLEKLGRDFVQTVEIQPPKGPDCAAVIEAARLLRAAGIDAVDISDNPLARVRMSSTMVAHVLKRETGMEAIIHYTCRDKNVLAIQSDMIGAYALGLRCILAITGDPLSVGDYPDAKAVFEINSTGLVNLIRTLNQGKDLAGNDIGMPTGWTIAVGINPLAEDWDFERKKIRDKIEGGARFAMTQPLYEPEAVEKFVRRMEEFPELPALVGILPVRTYRHAKFLDEEVPFISVPKPIIERMAAAAEKGKEHEREEGLALSAELYSRMRAAGAKGIYFMPPFEKYEMVVEMVRRYGAK